MKKILIPVDGSEFSDRAVLKGKEIAGAFGSQVILLNVMSVVTSINYYPNMRFAQAEAILDWPGIVAEAKEHSRKLLDEAKQSLGEMADRVETVIIDEPGGQIARAIADYAKEHDVDLIIMGSNGVGSLKQRMYLGSVTTKVLHIVTKPILVIQ